MLRPAPLNLYPNLLYLMGPGLDQDLGRDPVVDLGQVLARTELTV